MKKATPTLRGLTLAVLLALGSHAGAADPKASQFYEDALQRYANKDINGTIVQLKNALKADKKLLPAHVLLGQALLANGDVAAAEVALNEGLRLGANRAEVVVPLARTLVGQGRLGEVVAKDAKFELAGLPPPVQTELLAVIASAHAGLGSPKDALKAIEQARALSPNAPQSYLAEVPVQIRARNFAAARAAAEKAASLAPQEAEPVYLLGSVLHAQLDAKGALAQYDKALSLNPAHVEALLARAGIALDQRQYAQVEKDVAEAKKAAPLDPRAGYLGAMALQQQGKTKESKAALSEVVTLLNQVPINFMRYRPQVLMLGGLANYGLGNNDKAKPFLETLLRQMPESPAAKLLGQILLSEKSFDRAIETLESYRKVNAQDSQAAALLANAYIGKGRPARAAQVLQEALKFEDSPRLHTHLGLALVGAGKAPDALAELERAWRKDPNQIAAGAALVDLYLRSGQANKAIDIAEGLAKRQPKEAQLQALVGHARAGSGERVKARAAYEAALKLDPNFTAVQLGLARLDVQDNKPDDANKRLSAVLQREPNNVDALMEGALLAQRQGKGQNAVQLLSKAADIAGANPGAAIALIDLHLANGRIDAAKEALKAIEAKAPEALPVLVTGARVQITAKDPKAAQAYLSRAARTAEFDPRLLTRIGQLQLQADDAKAAAYTAGKALQADADHVPAKALLVEASLRAGDIATAEKTAKEVAAKPPKGGLAQVLQGDVALARNQPAVALEAYKAAQRAEPSTANFARVFNLMSRSDAKGAADMAEGWLKGHAADQGVRQLLANHYARNRQFAQAKPLFEALVTANPSNADAWNNLANVQLLLKDGKALASAEKAQTLKPDAPYIIGTVGYAAHLAGQDDRALQLLRDARLRDPNNSDTRFFLASVLQAKGRSAEAKEELKAAVAAPAGMTWEKEARELLGRLP